MEYVILLATVSGGIVICWFVALTYEGLFDLFKKPKPMPKRGGSNKERTRMSSRDYAWLGPFKIGKRMTKVHKANKKHWEAIASHLDAGASGDYWVLLRKLEGVWEPTPSHRLPQSYLNYLIRAGYLVMKE